MYIITPSGEINCSDNSNACKKSTCECDAEFARKLSQTWIDQRWNTFYWTHKKQQKDVATMDYENSCSSSGNNNAASDACCGDSYPNRFPYSSINKSCCSKSGKLYNSAVQTCCDDGSIKVAC